MLVRHVLSQLSYAPKHSGSDIILDGKTIVNVKKLVQAGT